MDEYLSKINPKKMVLSPGDLECELRSIVSENKKIEWKKMSGEMLDVDYAVPFPDFVADHLMDRLEETVEYFTGDLTKVQIFGKWHQIPRQQAAYGDPGIKYKYSGTVIPATPWPPILESIKRVVEGITGYKYNFVLINRYKDGRDHMGEHRDDEKELDRNTPITSLSLGQQRTFIFKHRDARVKGKLKRDIPPNPRTEELFLMSSPIPTMLITFLWFRFIMKWGPDFMKDRRPYDLKYVMIVYNIVQITINIYVVYYVIKARHVVNWSCFPVDYSNSYWGLKFLSVTHTYFLLKLLDLLDTVFFILRKKSTHLSFLHIYHHFGMALLGWCGTKYVGGGHSYFVGAANAIVHTILYSYYLLTAYDSKYSKLLWLKKFITQAQLTQFIFLLYMYSKILFMQDCGYPKVVSFFFVPQNFFMMILFGDFYVRTYIIEPNRKKKQLQNNKEGTNVVSEVKDA